MQRLTLTRPDEDGNPQIVDVITTGVPVERARLEAEGYRLDDLEQPATGDRVGAWRTYVVEQLGLPDAQAQALTKDELIALVADEPQADPAPTVDEPAGADPEPEPAEHGAEPTAADPA